MIKIRNLKKSFINQEVLNIPSLDFPNKGLFVLYGPSGSGKSTLLNIISGLEDYSGEVNVFSHNYHMMNDEQKDLYRLKNIGFVFQDFKLFENQTVKNNILFPLLTIEGKKKEKQDIKINTLLEYVNLKNKIDQPINNLSGGEKQRVAIARAIINNPKILLADEPTGALDHQNGIIVMDILKKLSNSCLVILVTHDYGLAQKYGDTILYLSDGKIIKKETLNNKSKEKLSLSLAPYNERKPSIPLSFLTSHYSTTNKKRKWRSR
ncbi:MAG: ABC transporter ATP-binding protein, partial [Bacilli bacterium]|nr:ABC transporter ATP-binding protein [Bacilli bacterium]